MARQVGRQSGDMGASGRDRRGRADPVPTRPDPGGVRPYRAVCDQRRRRRVLRAWYQTQSAAGRPGRRNARSAGTNRRGHAVGGHLLGAEGVGDLRRHPGRQWAHRIRVPGGAVVPPPGPNAGSLDARPCRPRSGQPGDQAAASPSSGGGLRRGVPRVRRRPVPTASATDRAAGRRGVGTTIAGSAPGRGRVGLAAARCPAGRRGLGTAIAGGAASWFWLGLAAARRPAAANGPTGARRPVAANGPTGACWPAAAGGPRRGGRIGLARGRRRSSGTTLKWGWTAGSRSDAGDAPPDRSGGFVPPA